MTRRKIAALPNPTHRRLMRRLHAAPGGLRTKRRRELVLGVAEILAQLKAAK